MMDQYSIAKGALTFFCFPALEQIASLSRVSIETVPNFFESASDDGWEFNYVFGVASVFVTYAGGLLDKFTSSERADALRDFSHRLNVFMHDAESLDRADARFLHAPVFDRLRGDATRALRELDECLPEEVPVFNVSELVRVSNFARRDLDI